MARYLEIARELQKRLKSREWAPGDKLPSVRTLSAYYGADKRVVNEALQVLQGWGHVRVPTKAAAIVLDRATPKIKLSIGRTVDRNEYGYVYNPNAGHWGPIGEPSRRWLTIDEVPELTHQLELGPGARLLARHRVVGPEEPMQTTTTYMVEWLGRKLDVTDTGPGGWLDRVEHDMGHGPVRWHPSVSSRLPNEQEAKDLGLSLAMPVLVLAFAITGHGHRLPMAVDVMTFDASRFEVEYVAQRSAAARWPTTPATERNSPVPHTK